MVKKYFIFNILFFSFGISFAEDIKPEGVFDQPISKHAQKKMLKQARRNFKKANYPGAEKKYIQLLNADSTNFNYNFELGFLYYEAWYETLRSLPYFERALRHSPKDTLGELYFYLGDAYQVANKPTEAHYYFSNYLYRLQKNGTGMPKTEEKDLMYDVKLRMEQCNNIKTTTAALRTNNTIEINGKNKTFTIENQSMSNINSPFDDYSLVLAPNDSTVFFTSRREGGIGRKTNDIDGKYLEDIYTSSLGKEGWSEAVNVGKPMNTKGYDASNCISSDGKTMYIYRGLKRGSIYKSEKNGSTWSKPKKVGSSVNSRAWETSSVIISNNILYLVSDRKGGFGGRDIYKCTKKEDGTWGEMENLGNKINTPHDEESPFLTPDGKTLFFSSTGHNSMGGFDIFKSQLNEEGNWNEPENLGTEINSSSHDIFFVLDRKMNHAYFSSNRVRDSIVQMDIYAVNFECEIVPVTVKGFSKSGISFSVTEKNTRRLIGNYTADSNGEYTLQLVTNNTYLFSLVSENTTSNSENSVSEAPAEIFIPQQCKKFTLLQRLQVDSTYQQNPKTGEVKYATSARFDNLLLEGDIVPTSNINDMIVKAEKEKAIGYTTSTATATGKYEVKHDVASSSSSSSSSSSPSSSAIVFQNVLFEYNKSTLSVNAKEELKKVVMYLKENKDKTILIAAHSDNAGTDEYNMNLTEKRAKAVVSYLSSKGIQKKRIESNAFGETKPVADNNTVEGREKNRRAELYIAK